MRGSRCVDGHGTWAPERPRCPVCARPVDGTDVPDEGRVLTWTDIGDERVAIVDLGDGVHVPAVVGPTTDVGAVVRLQRAGERFLATAGG